MKLPSIIKIISDELLKYNAKALVVGGSVRDHFLELPIKDYDVEVYGLKTLDELEIILSKHGSVNLVGKSFGVLKFVYEGEEYDFSFPRTEQKIALGHKGFDIACNGTLSFEIAALRRDFTVNAMAYDVQEQIFLDPFGAKIDMKNKVLRHINTQTFVEDPLRVYRAIQFCARFQYTLDIQTFELCKNMVHQGILDELPKERVYAEFTKLLLKAKKPSMGFELMRKLGIIKKYYPELYALIDVPQSPIWHPEGDVWTHTLMCLDKMVTLLIGDEKKDLKMMFAILSHDLGKATHTQITSEKISALGHELAGIEPTERLMYRLMDEHDFIESLLPLVEHHLAPSIYFRGKAKDSTIRRLANKVNIEELVTVARADFLGRTTEASLKGIYEAGDWLLEKARSLDVYNTPITPLLQGRDLIDLGYAPSKKFKDLLALIYNEQVEGRVLSKEDGINFIKNLKYY
ncbi:MAG: tRNA nucleotidyltransferase (EC (EC [uncultured Sulfurovum sp.]|uniref:tRNA nucleotidyltransferase ) n=1 Tax=uncultured Sulfurovum sp. TaxID=269237 RepID=A0A6S6S298_9BACT|nr:MAG: tRNA nucleotidyltransferase (EC (EC [uncultured Sulfurovum sp.]